MKKDPKLRIPVPGTNRKFYLIPPRPELHRPDYSYRIEVSDERRAALKCAKTIQRSTLTNVLNVAKIRAAEQISSYLFGDGAKGEGSKLKRDRARSTLGELLDLYRPLGRDVQSRTIIRNKSTVLLFAREVSERENVRDLPVSEVLTAPMRRKFIQARLDAVNGKDLMVQESAAHSINTLLAMVQSVISPKVMHLYASLALDLNSLEEFRRVRRLRTDKRHVAYRRLPQQSIADMEADAQLLRSGQSTVAAGLGLDPDQQKRVYLAYLLMSRLGLRNVEALNARWSWIERRENRSYFVIERRADFVPKNKSDRTIELSGELLTKLDSFRALPDAWIVPGPLPTRGNGGHSQIRADACHGHLNAWLRVFLPARVCHHPGKGAYLLRKEAGSRIAERPEAEGGGIQAAADFLGDSVMTTEKYYRGRRRSVMGVQAAELRAAA